MEKGRLIDLSLLLALGPMNITWAGGNTGKQNVEGTVGLDNRI